jgi:hypothetical protein
VEWPRYSASSAGSKIFVYRPTPGLEVEFVKEETVEFWRYVYRMTGTFPFRKQYGALKPDE